MKTKQKHQYNDGQTLKFSTGVHETLLDSSSKESLMYVIIPAISKFFMLHGLRDSNSRHLVLETSALPTELNPFLFDTKGIRHWRTPWSFKTVLLVEQLCHLTCTYSTPTFANRETQTYVQCNRRDQINCDGQVVSRHNHLNTVREIDVSRYVSCAYVELWTVVIVEWCVTTTFFFFKIYTSALNSHE